MTVTPPPLLDTPARHTILLDAALTLIDSQASIVMETRGADVVITGPAGLSTIQLTVPTAAVPLITIDRPVAVPAAAVRTAMLSTTEWAAVGPEPLEPAPALLAATGPTLDIDDVSYVLRAVVDSADQTWPPTQRTLDTTVWQPTTLTLDHTGVAATDGYRYQRASIDGFDGTAVIDAAGIDACVRPLIGRPATISFPQQRLKPGWAPVTFRLGDAALTVNMWFRTGWLPDPFELHTDHIGQWESRPARPDTDPEGTRVWTVTDLWHAVALAGPKGHIRFAVRPDGSLNIRSASLPAPATGDWSGSVPAAEVLDATEGPIDMSVTLRWGAPQTYVAFYCGPRRAAIIRS